MADNAHCDHRLWLAASVAAGASFWFVRDAGLPIALLLAWKGSGVALLAIWAMRCGHARIAAVLAPGAVGDVLIEWTIEAGAAAFLAGHVLAIRLYWHSRLQATDRPRALAAVLLLAAIPALAFVLPDDRDAAPMVAFYACGLATMTAAALVSTYPLHRVGLGAVLFAASDLLIFARMGPLAQSPLPGQLIWPLYYLGQFLIATGVVGTDRRRS